jgi:hypothetical protein
MMKSLRTTIPGLMIAVAISAVAITALRTASDLYLKMTYSAVTALLLYAIVAARYRRGNKGAFWFGFAVFGWGYFVLSSVNNDYDRNFYDPQARMNSNLITSNLICRLVPLIRKTTYEIDKIEHITENTIGVADLLVTLTIAMSGGLLAVLLRTRRRRNRIAKSNPSRSRATNTIVATLILIGLGASPRIAALGYFNPPPPPIFPAETTKRIRNNLDEIYQNKLDEAYNLVARLLVQMNEKPLWNRTPKNHDSPIFRLIWMGTYTFPVCVRIEKKGRFVELHLVVLDRVAGEAPGRIAIERRFQIDEKRWDRLIELATEADFWKSDEGEIEAFVNKSNQGEFRNFDLIVEGYLKGRYRVNFLNPDPKTRFLASYMIELSGVRIPSSEMFDTDRSSPE